MTRHRPRPHVLRAMPLFALAAAIAVSSACDKDNILAPTGSDLTLVTTTSTISATGSLDVTAHLFRGAFSGGADGTTIEPGAGPPVRDDTIVTFVTTLGRIEPSEAKTKDGRVTVKLVGDGQAGTAKITAFSGAAFGTLDITLTAADSSR